MRRALALLVLCHVSVAIAEPRPRGLVQLTGKQQRIGQTRYRMRSPADPFVDVAPDGRVRVYGTTPYGKAHYHIEYPSLDAMLRGGKYQTKKLPLQFLGKENGWDFNVHRFAGGEEVLYAGVMRPPAGRKHARWPDDNWTRRIYPFVKNAQGQWTMKERPLFGAVDRDARPGYLGHSYGHHFKEIGGDLWLFHEEVSGEIQTPNGPRMKTEIFARKMLDPFTASDEKVKLLGVGDPPLLGKRRSGDFLIEGPRPFDVDIRGQEFHFISFSAADFAGDGYDIHFAWRRGSGIGEYTPMTGKNGALRGFGEKLKQKHGLSWLGRAQVVKDAKGRHWAVFHAVDKKILPERDYSGKSMDRLRDFQRNLYAVPIAFRLGKDGAPRIDVLD